MINTSHLEKKEKEEEETFLKKYAVNTTNPQSFEPDFPREDPDLRKYSVKVVKSGNFIQVYEYHRSRSSAKPGKGNKVGQGKHERIRMDNIYRAITSCKRLINTNRDRGLDSDKFVTLTFAEDSWTDLSAVNCEMHKFIKRLEYQLKIKARYVTVPQIQWERYEKYGCKVWHLHVYFFGLAYIPNARLREIWNHGFVRINAINKEGDVGSYVTQYMERDFTAFSEKGMKRFYRSSGLLEPEELRAESVAQILGTMDLPEDCRVFGPQTYVNSLVGGAITYSLYDLRKQEVLRNEKEIQGNNETKMDNQPSGHTTVRGVS